MQPGSVKGCVKQGKTASEKDRGRTAATVRLAIILLPPDDGLHRGGRDEPQRVARPADRAAPDVRAATGRDRRNAGPRPTGQARRLIPPQRPAQHRTPRSISPVRPNRILREVEPDRGNRRHDRSPFRTRADPPRHIEAAGARSHYRSPVRAALALSMATPLRTVALAVVLPVTGFLSLPAPRAIPDAGARPVA
jgi:hypothetical protein